MCIRDRYMPLYGRYLPLYGRYLPLCGRYLPLSERYLPAILCRVPTTLRREPAIVAATLGSVVGTLHRMTCIHHGAVCIFCRGQNKKIPSVKFFVKSVKKPKKIWVPANNVIKAGMVLADLRGNLKSFFIPALLAQLP